MGKGRNLTALKKDGRDFPVEVSLAPFQTLEGLHILALVTDITERDEARRKLEAHTRALELINKDLDDFAYVASHDLRAPLTAIASLVQWLEEDTAGLLPESSMKHLTLIKSRVSRMAKLLEDLLVYSRAGRITNRIECVDTAELVGQVVDLIRGAVPLDVRTEGLPVFETVRTPLQQVLRNLISNAIKHHDRETCTLEITARESGPFHVFRVADDGPGIPRQFHGKVFNMFQTLRPRDEVEGSGMGLALVRKLVERYGGMVYVIETSGRGTTIEFTWPTRLGGG
jgi:signal transduction histidine kinase